MERREGSNNHLPEIPALVPLEALLKVINNAPGMEQAGKKVVVIDTSDPDKLPQPDRFQELTQFAEDINTWLKDQESELLITRPQRDILDRLDAVADHIQQIKPEVIDHLITVVLGLNNHTLQDLSTIQRVELKRALVELGVYSDKIL